DVAAPFGGPHFFAGFAFAPEVDPGEAFPAAFAFVPRWQVALAGTTTTAVANLVVTAAAELDPLAERVWRAHGKFRQFEYRSAAGSRGGATLSHRRGDGARAECTTRESGAFRGAVARAREEIEAGRLKKIVLARAQDLASTRPLHPLRMLNGLRQRFPDCYAF